MPVKKVSKKPVRKVSKKVMKKTSKTVKRKPSKKVHRGGALPPALVEQQKLRKFFGEEVGVKGGPALMQLIKHYRDEAKAKFPDASPEKLTEETKKIYEKDGKENAKKLLNELIEKRKK